MAAAKARHHRKRSRRSRRPRPRALASALLLALLIAGGGVVLSGALPVGDADLEAEGAADDDSTTTTAPTTTEAPTTTTTIATTTTTTTPPPAADGKLELGEAGPEVAALQQRLSDLGYWLGTADGTYGQLTRQAVMAFQKASGLGRDGVAGPATQAALQGAGRVAPSQPTGTHIEIDLARQLLIVVEGGHARWVLNTSTGNGEAYADPGGGTAVATTPAGAFSVYREIDGLRRAPLGNLYRPKYFTGGIAIHGAGSIPAQPASHGCARVTNAAMDLLWSSGAAAIGTPVIVY